MLAGIGSRSSRGGRDDLFGRPGRGHPPGGEPLSRDRLAGLTRFLQESFAERVPAGWRSRPEIGLLSRGTADLLGYAPRADVLLEKADGSRRIWIEFEISRADPVANHAKFATAHLFEPQRPGDSFLAMVSPHVSRGRRNLAANMISVMRAIGMSAFQTVLFPELDPEEVKALNHAAEGEIRNAGLLVGEEVEKALRIVDGLFDADGRRIHFAADPFDVLRNVATWNEEIRRSAARDAWGSRTVTYFVLDPWTGRFAPSKFCAYVPEGGEAAIPGLFGDGQFRSMNVALYASIPETAPSFDGQKAWRHLSGGLGFGRVDVRADATVAGKLDAWLDAHRDVVKLHPAGPVVLVPPPWLR